MSDSKQNNRRRVLERDEHRCVYCRTPATTVDHVVPLNLGGTWRFSNLVAACASCNQNKGRRSMKDWLVTKTAEQASTIMARVHAARIRRVPEFTIAEHEAKVIARLQAVEKEWLTAQEVARTTGTIAEIRAARKGLKEARRRLGLARRRLAVAICPSFPGPPTPREVYEEGKLGRMLRTVLRYGLPDDPER